MTCNECFKNNLELQEQYLDANSDKKVVFMIEVYKCSDCQKIQTIRRIG